MTQGNDRPSNPQPPWYRRPELALLILLVVGIYFFRMSSLPIRGEESRWARGAVQMIETGDWVVPRQQGSPFLDRPPLASWLMATAGLVRGQVDVVAVRLPSVIAILLTALLIYTYGQTFLNRFGAFACGAIYITFGQVVQIGRLGENDAVYALLVSGALLVWHWGYSRSWSPTSMWMAGYSLAAAGAMQKGFQSVTYFVFVAVVFLAWRRDWRTLFHWGHLAGIMTLVAILAAWVAPFYLATDLESTLAIWTQTITYRFTHQFSLSAIFKHLATYPFEVFACLLPWSPVLLALFSRRVRATIGPVPPQVAFVVTAVLATFPSLWLATEAKTRYFMCLYPCMAVLLGWILQRCVMAERKSELRLTWNRLVTGLAFLILCGGVAVAMASFSDAALLSELKQPAAFAALFSIVAAATFGVLLWSRQQPSWRPAVAGMFAIAVFMGLSYTGAVVNGRLRNANDMTPTVTELRSRLPEPEELVSFGAISHRFAYYYGSPIKEVAWPLDSDEVPPEVTYFCYDQHPDDNEELRANGRVWAWGQTPGTLPFEWEKVDVLPTGRSQDDPGVKVIVGRIVRPLRVAKKHRKAD